MMIKFEVLQFEKCKQEVKKYERLGDFKIWDNFK